MKKRVSFDFDATLSIDIVQEFVTHLQKFEDIEIWVVTIRMETQPNCLNPNFDLFKVTDKLNIPRENIRFANFTDKFPILKELGMLCHLDDDVIELSMIKDYTSTIPVCHTRYGEKKYGGPTQWRAKILECLKIDYSKKFFKKCDEVI